MDFVMNVLDYKKVFVDDMKKCKELAAKTTQIIRINCYDLYKHVVTFLLIVDCWQLGWFVNVYSRMVLIDARDICSTWSYALRHK